MRLLPAAAAAVVLAAPFAGSALAQTPGPMPGHHPMMQQGTVLSLSVQGEVRAAPDQATVSLGVVTEGDTAEAAMRANATRMTALMQALRRAGVAERDIQTSQLSVNPQYVYVENEQPRIQGYVAQNTVNATVRDLARLGRTLDAAVSAGGNTLNGVSFGLQDPDAAEDAARRDAMREALERARLYADASGLRVGRILSISEGGGYMPPPMPMMAQAREFAMDSAPTPVSPGELMTQVSLSVMFELNAP